MTRLHSLLLLASLVALLGAGCPSESEPQDSSDADATDTEDATDTDTTDTSEVREQSRDIGDDEETTDPDCHYDCFPHFTCIDGEVFYQSGGPIPCDVGGAELCTKGPKVGDCEDGCRADSYSPTWPNDPDSWPVMCEENRARVVGEPCGDDADCEPTERYIDPETDEAVAKALVCDTDAGECVDPNAAGYLDFCDADPADIQNGAGYLASDGDVAFDGCATGNHCVVRQTDDESCQFCTIECENEADCPSGSSCSSAQNLDQFDDSFMSVCVMSDGVLQREYVECTARP